MKHSVYLVSILFFLMNFHFYKAQQKTKVYKINDLTERIKSEKKPAVINFWATWCKPCIQELPSFDSLAKQMPELKVLLICLDFKEDLNTKVEPFIEKHKILSEVILLDEVNGNDFINKISPDWTGAIPGTLFVSDKEKFFIEKKMDLKELKNQVSKLK